MVLRRRRVGALAEIESADAKVLLRSSVLVVRQPQRLVLRQRVVHEAVDATSRSTDAGGRGARNAGCRPATRR